MARPRIYGKRIMRNVYIEEDDFEYISKNGINMSKLFNMAIKGVRNGDISYSHDNK